MTSDCVSLLINTQYIKKNHINKTELYYFSCLSLQPKYDGGGGGGCACQSMSCSLTGFLLMAPPTARTALGFPAISARRLYETVSPNFTSF